MNKQARYIIILSLAISLTALWQTTRLRAPQESCPEQAENIEDAKPISQQTATQEYFPIKNNDVWEYEGTRKEKVDGEIKTTQLNKVIKVNSIATEAGTTTFTLSNNQESEQWVIENNTIDFEPKETTNKFKPEFPLYVGQKWGDDDQLRARDDGFYVWQVKEKLSKTVLGKEYPECFMISYKTVPDTTYKIFCYDLGIVETGYAHHGSLLEENYHLISH